MDDENPEGKVFATFEKHGEFLKAQRSFLSLDLFEVPSSTEDDKREDLQFRRLSKILHEYQEQSYLLDPFLEGLVEPAVECLKSHAKACIANRDSRSSPTRVERVALLIYTYVKCRGYKTIIRFFPHEITDLSIALEFLLIPDGLIHEPSQWALRYVILIWLSLICMLPFDLSQFDDANQADRTADTIELYSKRFLGKAGIEREGATVLLSRLYMRKDTSSRFQYFLDWSHNQLKGDSDIFMSIGILQVLCEVLTSGSAEQIECNIPKLLSIVSIVEGTPSLSNNTTIRKVKIKLISRIVLRMLPARANTRLRKGRTLAGFETSVEPQALEEDIDVPEQVEVVLEQLFKSLQDKDTVVRWSAAKNVGRISERLPTDFADQVFETVMGLFAIHSITAASLYALPAIAESTWHGACLACAEMARRGLIAPDRITELIGWLSKALYFDLRKGAHSIGSSVRDAAAYVLWALARTQDPLALIPHSMKLAQHLVAISLYDREVHIRRAASAAFQEHVGRNGLFPHGIDVLTITDFYSISVRRNAFLTAAPQVAEHPEYRDFLINHILDVVLRHWDQTMRELGSHSLRLICVPNLSTLGPQICTKVARLLESIDITDIHGALLALCEISEAYHESGSAEEMDFRMRDIFQLLSCIPFDIIIGPRNTILTAAACRLISVTLTSIEIYLAAESLVPRWKEIVDHGLKHRSTVAQHAAADAMRSASKIVDCSSVNTLIRELKTGSSVLQQSLGTVLGALDYDAHTNSLPEVLECLVDCAKPASVMKLNLEARRNCYLALPQILSATVSHLSHHMTSDVVNSLYDTLLGGLDDYTIDERGDVGSWIRIACIQGLTSFSETLILNAGSIPSFDVYFPSSKYHCAIAGILRQGVERLDNVRQEAGENLMRLLALPLPAVDDAARWNIPSASLLKETFQDSPGVISWKDGKWLFPRAVRLLGIKEYRKPVLTGLVLSFGSKTDSVRRPLVTSFTAYVQSLNITDEDASYDVNSLVEDLFYHAEEHVKSNMVLVPVLITFNVLLEGGTLIRLSNDSRGLKSLRQLLSIATQNVNRLKSVPRIYESMKIVINLLPFKPLFRTCVESLHDFLGHRFPSVRRDTAEYLYIMLQGVDLGWDTDVLEEVLLETEWSSTDLDVAKEAATRIVTIFCENE